MSGELGDVIGGDTVAAGFTNAVKDRTAMRYANATERDALVPTPAGGELAWLNDVSGLTMWVGTYWADVPRTDINGNVAFGANVIVTAPDMFQGPGAVRSWVRIGESLNATIETNQPWWRSHHHI